MFISILTHLVAFIAGGIAWGAFCMYQVEKKQKERVEKYENL